MADNLLPRPTSISRKLAAMLRIDRGEERLVGLLILFYFVLALGFVFVQSMAFGIFLTEYGVRGLPYSYIAIAIVASLAALVYIRLSGRVSFSRLLFLNVAFLGGASVLIWLALLSPLHHATAFILPLWFQIVVNFGNLAVWPLAGSLFDFRQGKRLFPLLGAGNWLANIIGGFFVPMLVRSVGTTNLLLLGGISFGAALLVLRAITRAYLRPKAVAPQAPARSTSPAKTPAGFFKDRYVLLIFAYTVLWWLAFFFVDNIFYNRAYAQYPDADQLTAFIGQLLSVMGVVALISSTVLTSRVIARFGLKAGLLAMPLLVTFILGVLAVSGSLGASLLIVFAMGALAKLVNVAFGFSLSQSANAIVYQSLPDTVRGRVQATAEGVVQPVAVGLAGILLLVLTAGLKFNYIGLAYVFIGLGIAWLIVILRLSGKYIGALKQAVSRRRLGDSPDVLADPASLALLRSRLQDPHPGVVIYALNRLDALDGQVIAGELPALVQHPAPEVRREAFVRIERLRLRAALPAVQKQLAAEIVPAVREAGLRALGAVAEGGAPELEAALDEADVHSRRGAMIGSLRWGHETTARRRLDDYLASSSNADRCLAMEVAGDLNWPELYPQLIAACDSPETSRAAGLALASIGPAALPQIEPAYSQPDAPPHRLMTLARVLGRIGGVQSQRLLYSRLSSPDGELRTQILSALNDTKYRAEDLREIQSAVRAEAEQTARLSATRVDLEGADRAGLLREALDRMPADARERVLLLLSFAFDARSTLQVRDALRGGSANQVSYALEIIDTQLPAEWKPVVMPLLENLPAQERLQRLAATFPQTKQPPEARLASLVVDEHLPRWVRTCAEYALAHGDHKGDPAMLSTVEKVLILKSVPMFSRTPDNVLADVAGLLEEFDVTEGQTIFAKGDPGDSLYVIVDGRVRVHDGERLLNYLGERDVFGEMALLDPEPRLASVTAVEPTRLFRLDQAPFYELMEERPEVATGIIRVLAGHLRNRVRDIAQLNARIKELQGTGEA